MINLIKFEYDLTEEQVFNIFKKRYDCICEVIEYSFKDRFIIIAKNFGKEEFELDLSFDYFIKQIAPDMRVFDVEFNKMDGGLLKAHGEYQI